jgi:hypothetical protein
MGVEVEVERGAEEEEEAEASTSEDGLEGLLLLPLPPPPPGAPSAERTISSSCSCDSSKTKASPGCAPAGTRTFTVGGFGSRTDLPPLVYPLPTEARTTCPSRTFGGTTIRNWGILFAFLAGRLAKRSNESRSKKNEEQRSEHDAEQELSRRSAPPYLRNGGRLLCTCQSPNEGSGHKPSRRHPKNTRRRRTGSLLSSSVFSPRTGSETPSVPHRSPHRVFFGVAAWRRGCTRLCKMVLH